MKFKGVITDGQQIQSMIKVFQSVAKFWKTFYVNQRKVLNAKPLSEQNVEHITNTPPSKLAILRLLMTTP